MTREYVACVLCGSEKYTVLIRGIASGDLVRCDSCGLCRANPRYTDQLVFSAMGKHYAPILAVEKVQDKEALGANWRYRLRIIERWVSKGRMLDVGCYAGTFLAVAREGGWETSGVDPAISGSSYARNELGLDVLTATLAEAKFPTGYFDVVTMFHVMEHLPDPSKELTEVRRILRPRGILIVEVPNIDCMWFRLLGRRFRHLLTPDHFWFFSEETMHKLLETRGFEVLEAMRPPKMISVRKVIHNIALYMRPVDRLLNVAPGTLSVLTKVCRINLGDLLLCVARRG